MKYQVMMDRRTLIMLLAALALAGGLLFLAGVLVGIHHHLPSDGDGAPAAAYRPPPGGQEAGPPASAQRASTPPPVTRPVAPRSAAGDARATPQGDAGAPSSPPPAGAFSIQVGAFAIRDNADAHVDFFRGQGYEPYIVEVNNAENGVMYTVRIGRYSTREEAAWAASNFIEQEDMSAVVAPLNSG